VKNWVGKCPTFARKLILTLDLKLLVAYGLTIVARGQLELLANKLPGEACEKPGRQVFGKLILIGLELDGCL